MKSIASRLLIAALSLLFVATLLPAGAAQRAAAPRGDSWSYAGKTGPANWAKLDKDFALCGEGVAQSPVDIPDKSVRKGDFPSMLFNYKPSPLTVVDTGREIEVKFEPGSYFTLDGVRYDLVSLELHKPGEHKVDGKGHEMEAQLVHKVKDKQAVLAVPVAAGNENPVAKAILANLPAKGTDKSATNLTINPVDLLPSNKDYYGYAGSLAAPPCTENVEWIVLKSPITFSADQIARFAKVYPANARPTQPVNGRDIRGSR